MRWYKKRDKLPEDGNGVLIYGHYNNTTGGTFFDTCFYEDGEFKGINKHERGVVTHWCYLQAPK